VDDPIERAVAEISFGADGLVPAIAQQHDTGEVLMMAWMNPDAVRASLAEGRACYWSRSRAKLWRKGETSGQIQWLRELRLDCDGDTVLLLVNQSGVACHTGRRSCFFRAWRNEKWTVIAEPQVPPESLYPDEARHTGSLPAGGARRGPATATAGTSGAPEPEAPAPSSTNG
jgi:phosphoribosyl-AMP cyclohydrolase